jgi:hypothetical protein
MFRPLLLSVLSLTILFSADPFAGRSYTPSATGLVITQFAPDAQAERLGLQVGDIIIRYAGKPMRAQADLLNAVKENTADAVIEVRRGEQAITATAKPGRLGVYMTPVEGGKVLALPPDTSVAFSTTRLQNGPIDTWYDFIIDGKKAGAEHARLELAGGRLTITVEVMFDGGERWGLNHMIEIGVLDVSGTVPRVVTQAHESPLSGFRSSGRWKDVTTWELTVDAKNEDGTPLHEVATSTPDGPLINDYSFSFLPALMPTAHGACHHTRTVPMNDAEPTGWSALLVIGPETTQVGSERLDLVRMEQRSLRGTGWVAWVRDGEVLKHDYSGGQGTTIAIKTTKEKALAGLNEKLVPRTAR